jgi:hypothetical protein
METQENIQILTREEHKAHNCEDFTAIIIPDKSDLIHKEIHFLYCIKDHQLVLVDDGERIRQIVEDMKREGKNLSASPEIIFMKFWNILLKMNRPFFSPMNKPCLKLKNL